MSDNSENFLLEYQSAQDYLKLSRIYAEYLGGLRWSGSDDAIVDVDNRIFAFCEAIAEFVEGFASEPRVIPFGYLLHWMDLLLNRRQLAAPAVQRLHAAFAATGSRWRFAGAFAAALSREVPETPHPPDLAIAAKRVRNRAFPIRWFVSQFHETQYPGQEPPIPPLTFEDGVIRRLAEFSDDELRGWLKTGRGPTHGGERLAEAPPLPRSLARVLASLVERPRLAGAETYVAQLVSALALPPRRFVPQELPVGGYSDIVTRGQVEYLLPTQFALDELEFLRRFAEKELLYFRREEPPAQNRQELVVLLDQGVRTWGDVRLVLAAAALAFGKQAILRKTPFFLAATSNGGAVVEPIGHDDEALGNLIEASDLSLNPGLALETTLESTSEALRDIVLLTHPRSLCEPDVQAAARRLPPRDRLFAVALDRHGEVEISEIRRGTSIRVRTFHVDFAPSAPKPRRPSMSAAGPMWTGDVEAIPFPFRIGTEPHVTQFDFDYEGQWVLVASGQGTLHLWKLDGSAQEMLPRAGKRGLMKQILAVHGVAGGFVVAGRIGDEFALAHYDVVRRCCKLYELGRNRAGGTVIVYYPESHRVLLLGSEQYNVHLSLEKFSVAPILDASASIPVEEAAAHIPVSSCQRGMSVVQQVTQTLLRALAKRRFCDFDAKQGSLRYYNPDHVGTCIIPMADGKRCLAGAEDCAAQSAGPTLAVAADRRDIGASITLVRLPDGAIVREIPFARPKHKITRHLLSFDGARIGLLRSDHRVEVEHIYDRSVKTLCTRVGGYSAEAQLMSCDEGIILTLGASNQFWHGFDWFHGKLEHHYERRTREARDPGIIRMCSRLVAVGDTMRVGNFSQQICRDRFTSAAQLGWVYFLLDRFGQVAVLDRNEKLLAMFVAFRDRWAAWMPDGTRCGSLTMSLGPATPGAAEKIGAVLRSAGRLPAPT